MLGPLDSRFSYAVPGIIAVVPGQSRNLPNQPPLAVPSEPPSNSQPRSFRSGAGSFGGRLAGDGEAGAGIRPTPGLLPGTETDLVRVR